MLCKAILQRKSMQCWTKYFLASAEFTKTILFQGTGGTDNSSWPYSVNSYENTYLYLLELWRNQVQFWLFNTILASVFKAKMLLKNVKQNTNIRGHKSKAEKRCAPKEVFWNSFFLTGLNIKPKKCIKSTSLSQCHSISTVLGPQNPQTIFNTALAPLSMQIIRPWVVP